MIASKENDRNTTVRYFGKFSLKSNKSFWNSVFVLKPEVKDIAHQVNAVSFMFYRIQPTNNSFFTINALLVTRHTQMKVGCEKDFLIGLKLYSHVQVTKNKKSGTVYN